MVRCPISDANPHAITVLRLTGGIDMGLYPPYCGAYLLDLLCSPPPLA